MFKGNEAKTCPTVGINWEALEGLTQDYGYAKLNK